MSLFTHRKTAAQAKYHPALGELWLHSSLFRGYFWTLFLKWGWRKYALQGNASRGKFRCGTINFCYRKVNGKNEDKRTVNPSAPTHIIEFLIMDNYNQYSKDRLDWVTLLLQPHAGSMLLLPLMICGGCAWVTILPLGLRGFEFKPEFRQKLFCLFFQCTGTSLVLKRCIDLLCA